MWEMGKFTFSLSAPPEALKWILLMLFPQIDLAGRRRRLISPKDGDIYPNPDFRTAANRRRLLCRPG
jgi:hypothetical protein